ncbi:MAG TPA: hypothetical protein VGL61_12350 [Kofleriaceae bacterium]|jgi:hypothetical protein
MPDAISVADRGELEVLFGRMVEASAAGEPAGQGRTLDLVGYATPDKLLAFGDWTIDANDRGVVAFFRELAEHEVLPRLGIAAVRLLGSLTGATTRGMAALRTLAKLLGVEVYGTTELVCATHFKDGRFIGSLVASDADPTSTPPMPPPLGARRELLIDALPARPLVPGVPIAVASSDHARALVQLIARTAGTVMPGLLARPYCELALPSGELGAYHRLELLLAGDYVRTYPDGPNEPGVVFAVRDRHAALQIVGELLA